MNTRLLLLALLAGSTAQAQLTIKPKVGLVINRLRDPDADEEFYHDYQERVFAPQAGVGFSYSFRKISLQGEVLYSEKSARYVIKPDITAYGLIDWVQQYRFRYLEVPVSAHIPFGNRLYVGVGAYYAFLLDAKYSTNSRMSTDRGTDYFSRSDYGLLGEISLRFPFLELGVRYAHGLPNIQYGYEASADPELASGGRSDLGAQRSLQVSLAVPIRIGR